MKIREIIEKTNARLDPCTKSDQGHDYALGAIVAAIIRAETDNDNAEMLFDYE